MKFVNKATLVLEPVIEDSLFFLVKLYLKLVLCYISEINYYKVDFCNIGCELYWVGIEV